MSLIKALIIDLDGVIRHFPKERDEQIERKYGLHSGLIASVAFENIKLNRVITGQINDEQWRQEIAQSLSHHTPHFKQVEQEWSNYPGTTDMQMLNWISQVRKQIPVALLTNAT